MAVSGEISNEMILHNHTLGRYNRPKRNVFLPDQSRRFCADQEDGGVEVKFGRFLCEILNGY